jgi:hypothetical protein
VTVQQARNWVVLASLVACGATFVFFLLAPVFGYPLLWRESLRILELIVPVFLGYLGAAAYYAFRHTGKHSEISVPNTSRLKHSEISVPNTSRLMSLIIKGPVILFAIVSVAILIAFGVSNAQTAEQGLGMSVENLAVAFTAALGILTVTTNAAVSYLFSIESQMTQESAHTNEQGPSSPS